MDDLISKVIIGLVAGIPGYVALYLAFKRHPVETKKMSAEAREANGNAAESFATVAKMAGDLNVEQQSAIDKLSQRVDEQGKQIAEQGKTIQRLNKRTGCLERVLERCARRIAYLMGGIEMLMRQVTSLNAKPVWTPDEWDMYVEDPAEPEE